MSSSEHEGDKPADTVVANNLLDSGQIDDWQEVLENHYRWFHQHPEPSYREFDTTARIRSILEQAGVAILDTGLNTGLVAAIASPNASYRDAPTIAVRGDIDALPIVESTGAPYASLNSGWMHACGHDVNLTSVLGAALMLDRQREHLAGTVLFIFQPAEEVASDEHTPTGAVTILRTGVLNHVQTIIGVHDSPEYPAGVIGVSAGPVSGHVCRFAVTVEGKGSHAAHPDQGKSPIRAAAAIVQGIESVAGLELNPNHARVATVTHVSTGETWNVIPDTALIEGTVRTLGEHDADSIKRRMEHLVAGSVVSYDVHGQLVWHTAAPSVTNDPRWVDLVQRTARRQGITSSAVVPTLGGEDFAYYVQRIPGVFIHIGVAPAGSGLHSARFLPDVSGLAQASGFLAQYASNALDELDRPDEKGGARQPYGR